MEGEEEKRAVSPQDLILSSIKVPIVEAKIRVRTLVDLGGTTPADMSEAPKGKEEGSIAFMKAQTKVGEAQSSVAKTSM